MPDPTEGRPTGGRLAGQVALVTGAARGIGAAIARAFIAEGATVWLTDLSEPGDTHGADARTVKLDVREEADWSRVMAALLAHDRRLDLLVNNAGITGFEDGPAAHDPETATLAAWRAVHATNLDGVFLGCRAAIRAMRPVGRGAIVNLSSRSGFVGIPAAAAYASSKAAVRNHTRRPSQTAPCDAGTRARTAYEGAFCEALQDGGAVVRAAGPRDPLQLHPPGRDPHADLGRHAGVWRRSRGTHGLARSRHADAAIRDA